MTEIRTELVEIHLRRHERGFTFRVASGEEAMQDPHALLPSGLSDDDREQAEWWCARWARSEARDANKR